MKTKIRHIMNIDNILLSMFDVQFHYIFSIANNHNDLYFLDKILKHKLYQNKYNLVEHFFV